MPPAVVVSEMHSFATFTLKCTSLSRDLYGKIYSWDSEIRSCQAELRTFMHRTCESALLTFLQSTGCIHRAHVGGVKKVILDAQEHKHRAEFIQLSCAFHPWRYMRRRELWRTVWDGSAQQCRTIEHRCRLSVQLGDADGRRSTREHVAHYAYKSWEETRRKRKYNTAVYSPPKERSIDSDESECANGNCTIEQL